ncbi:MAG: FAD-dependent thymidylate synthase [Helicobacteraceae bacterium]|jgi:thymidylate synthase (FAD)|nr:FAD-dependent thymidylate synthase [Helicobacteraceae bacterium]
MKVTLLQHTSLTVCAKAIRTCWQSFDRGDNGGEKDLELIDRVGNKNKHQSTLEHLFYTFYIAGISRAALQELARHRVASLSVKSTRYTLKELKTEHPFAEFDDRAAKYLVSAGDSRVDRASLIALENLRSLLAEGIGNDRAKYALPESYRTELTWSINARSLQNFLSLRSSPHALWEMRDLAAAVFAALPDDHKYIFAESIEPNKTA